MTVTLGHLRGERQSLKKNIVTATGALRRWRLGKVGRLIRELDNSAWEELCQRCGQMEWAKQKTTRTQKEVEEEEEAKLP